MHPKNVRSIILTTEGENDLTQAVLFQAARYLSSIGCRVLYIAPEPLSALPLAINDDTAPDPESMSFISFVYLGAKDDLLFNLTSLISVHRPPQAIIVQHMEHYAKSADEASSVAAAMLNAAATCSHRLQTTTTLVACYKHPIPTILVRAFFQKVWCVHRGKEDKDMIFLNYLGSPVRCFQLLTQDSDAAMLQKVFEMEDNQNHSDL